MAFLNRQVWHSSDVVPRRYEKRLGGKGVGLFRLIRHPLPVPAFHVISTDAFEASIKSQRKTIDNLLATLNEKDFESIQSTSRHVQDLILNAQIPPSIQQRIRHALGAYGDGQTFAVRSSVVGEDSLENSFAGQMDSFLHVQRAHVIETVARVWASAFAPRALLYRAQRGLPLVGITTAAIIQQMVFSETSGVAFSRDPQSRAETCLISASYGLGEGVVQDQVEVDTYRVAADNTLEPREVGTKTRRMVCDGDAGTRLEPIPDHAQSLQVLCDRQILELAHVARTLEEALGSPQDMEWAYSQGQLFLLQTRPIVFSAQSGGTNGRVWDNANIVESYPGLTLPLTFSFVRECYAISFRRAVQGFLLRSREVQDESHIFAEMIGLLDGRVYYNLLNWYTMLSYLPGFRHYRKSWNRMIGIATDTPFPERRLSWLNRSYAHLTVLYRLLTVRSNARRFFRHFDPAYRHYQHKDFSRSGLALLVVVFRAMERDFSRPWHLTLYNDFTAMKYYDWLGKLCRRWGLEHHSNLYNDLLCGEPGVESVRPVHSILSICTLIQREPRFLKLFGIKDQAEIWRSIQNHTRFSALKVALDGLVDAFGDRGLEELKLERPTFRDRPEALVELIQSYITRGTTYEQLIESEETLRAKAEETVRRVLRNPIKRGLFAFVLRNTRLGVAQRENMRFARSRLFGVARRLFRRMAELFVDQGALSCQEDFYYLTVPEVFGYIQGHAVTQDLQRLTELRRQEYEAFGKQAPPDRLQTEGVPYPVPMAVTTSPRSGNGRLCGTGCSSGDVHGPAWVVSDPRAADRTGDYILVAESTDPGWVFLMIRARGIVVERGSVLSHTAIIGRELGIPTVVGVPSATTRIKDGHTIWLNGSTGEVQCA
jgi:phosphohistidine swiveling domain-containing protein